MVLDKDSASTSSASSSSSSSPTSSSSSSSHTISSPAALRSSSDQHPVSFPDVSLVPTTYAWSMQGKVEPWCLCSRFTVEGICKDEFCRAYGERVFCDPFSKRAEREFSWRVGSKQTRVLCPCCGSKVEPTSVGFYNCFFRAVGVLAGTGQTVDLLWREARNEYTTWDTGLLAFQPGGLAQWSRLEFFYRESPHQGGLAGQ